MWFLFFALLSTSQKAEAFDLAAVHLAAFHGVNSCCIYATVTKNIRKADNVLLQAVVGARKQVTEVVGKDLVL